MARKSFAKQAAEMATTEAQTEPTAPAPAADEKKSGYRVGQYMRKTYVLPESTVDRLSAIADKYNVGKNELARYLLDEILTQVESGDHELPVKPIGKNTLS